MLRTVVARLTLGLSAPLLLAGLALAMPSDHEDAAIGFSIKPPKGWKAVPLQMNEGYIVGKYISEKKYFDTSDGYTYDHQPTLRIIAFLDDGDPDDTPSQSDEETGEHRVRIDWHDDYEGYMRVEYPAGFYVDTTKDYKLKKIPVTQLGIKVENSVDVPHTITTWIYEIEAGTVAVEFEYLSSAEKKLKSTISKTLKSFKAIERVAATTGGGTESWLTVTSIEGLTQAQRADRLQQTQERFYQKSLAGLPDGWKSMEIDGIRVLTDVDKKYAKDVVERLVAVRNWMDTNFDRIGTGNYARYPLLRFFENQAEEDAFLTSSAINPNSYEVTTYRAMSFDQIFEDLYVNQTVLDYWLFDRDRNYYYSTPPWLRTGLPSLLTFAGLKGSKLQLRADTYGIEADEIRKASKEGNLFSCERLIRMTGAKERELSDEQSSLVSTQFGALLRYLLDGPGKKNKRTKTLLDDYLTGLDEVFAAIDAEEQAEEDAREKEREEKRKEAEARGEEVDDEEDEDEPQTEAEEEAALREKGEAGDAEQQRISDAAFTSAFGSWTDADWAAFEKAYLKYID